jgi:hypothetical protein
MFGNTRDATQRMVLGALSMKYGLGGALARDRRRDVTISVTIWCESSSQGRGGAPQRTQHGCDERRGAHAALACC